MAALAAVYKECVSLCLGGSSFLIYGLLNVLYPKNEGLSEESVQEVLQVGKSLRVKRFVISQEDFELNFLM